MRVWQNIWRFTQIILLIGSCSCRQPSEVKQTNNSRPGANENSTQKSEPLGRYAAEQTKSKTRGIKIAGERDRSLYFAVNSAEIDPIKAKLALDDINRKIVAPERKGHAFLIAGHADRRGSDEYNDKLSQARADAVRKILISKYGVRADWLTARGYGKQHPLDPADNELAWQANRRVELWDVTKTPEPYPKRERGSL
jgi:outer membrane protein OmpA-like peptidoglycan-associated protein